MKVHGFNFLSAENLHCKREVWAFSRSWLEGNLAIKFLYDLVSDYEAKADTLCVHLLGVLEETKKFEELVLIFVLYSDTCINDLYLQVSLIGNLDCFDVNAHTAFLCKLERIWLKTK